MDKESVVKNKYVNRRSLIKKYFNDDLYINILKTTLIGDLDNNEKATYIKNLLTENSIPWSALGSGTNRFAILIDGYAVKIALDKDGMIDNRREMLYTKSLQPYVVKVYECVPSGLIAVTEYVEIFNLDDFNIHKQDMRNILKDISTRYLIGDAGVTSRNYVNWGTRLDGSICILDFAYIYDVKFGTFTCECDDSSILRYDNDYVNLICPKCGDKHTFGEIRRRITRKMQEEEIGDIRRLSYNIKSPVERVIYNPKFEPASNKKKVKVKSEIDKIIENYKKGIKSIEIQDWDNPKQKY